MLQRRNRNRIGVRLIRLSTRGWKNGHHAASREIDNFHAFRQTIMIDLDDVIREFPGWRIIIDPAVVDIAKLPANIAAHLHAVEQCVRRRIAGALNLGGSIEVIPNAVRIAELAIDK